MSKEPQRSSATRSSGLVRLFCALELPYAVREKITNHITQLRSQVPDVKASWSRVENIHLTLKFIGEVPAERIEHLSQAAARAVVSVETFSLRLEETGSFPPHGAAKVLWIGISEPTGALSRLHGQLEEESEKEGFARELKRFHPHLTIARLRRPDGARRLLDAHRELKFGPVEARVSEVVVMRSELGASGSKYTALSRHPLG